MEMHNLQVTKTARYTTYGNPEKAKFIWIALHGYGQLVKYFSRNFEVLDPEQHFVICPEGLNRFYLHDSAGRVGATWMTKEARLTDIDDYVIYLNRIYEMVAKPIIKPGTKTIVFGFSQGVATASRWIALGNVKPDIAILWAGSFPPDLSPIKAKNAFIGVKTICCLGDDDEYINSELLESAKNHFNQLGISAEWITFKGKHVIDANTLIKISEQLKH
jgi:predicted esterase